MDIGVEISLYPLMGQPIACIHEFIDRLRSHGRFRVESNSMSTQVFGRYEDVFGLLQQELHASFEQLAAQGHKAVFVMKVLGPLESV
jgi:uncharacterized protein YqgV (UPF0045/DUF77 family)